MTVAESNAEKKLREALKRAADQVKADKKALEKIRRRTGAN
jgi:hypothetical protein